ncbi:MAG: hypothetical protein ACI8VC_001824 [Candidatus Endobugula sp.]|jgi:hypothetical protein
MHLKTLFMNTVHGCHPHSQSEPSLMCKTGFKKIAMLLLWWLTSQHASALMPLVINGGDCHPLGQVECNSEAIHKKHAHHPFMSVDDKSALTVKGEQTSNHAAMIDCEHCASVCQSIVILTLKLPIVALANSFSQAYLIHSILQPPIFSLYRPPIFA